MEWPFLWMAWGDLYTFVWRVGGEGGVNIKKNHFHLCRLPPQTHTPQPNTHFFFTKLSYTAGVLCQCSWMASLHIYTVVELFCTSRLLSSTNFTVNMKRFTLRRYFSVLWVTRITNIIYNPCIVETANSKPNGRHDLSSTHKGHWLFPPTHQIHITSKYHTLLTSKCIIL